MLKVNSKIDLTQDIQELSKPFWDALEKESDRAIAVIATCILDTQLEELIRASYIKDARVKLLFKSDHILQTYFAKINIAYFSGLIPEPLYNDLKIIAEIRNSFAHQITGNMNFSATNIANKIDKFNLTSKEVDKIFVPKMKFILTIQILVAFLATFKHCLNDFRLPNLVERLKLNDIKWDQMALTKEELISAVIKEKIKKRV